MVAHFMAVHHPALRFPASLLLMPERRRCHQHHRAQRGDGDGGGIADEKAFAREIAVHAARTPGRAGMIVAENLTGW